MKKKLIIIMFLLLISVFTPLVNAEDSIQKQTSENKISYTVEFNYNNKEYVMEGNTTVKLDTILKFLNLKGEVSSWKVSNKTLFNIKKNNNILYMVSFKPFTSKEWLKVVIDDVEYKIDVLDAIRVDDNGTQVDTNVSYMDSSGNAVPITDDRVIQGPTEHDFTASMPLAEIFIDDDIVNMNMWKNDSLNGSKVVAELLVNSTQNGGKYKAFTLNTTTTSTSPSSPTGLVNSYGGLCYDFSKRYLNNTQNLTVTGTNANNYELFSGDIVKYTLKGMAVKYDSTTKQYKNYDVVITYSDVLITLCNSSGTAAVNQSLVNSNSGKLTLFDTNLVYPFFTGSSPTHRVGITYKSNVKVVDPDTGNVIPGSYYFPMVDIDISRNTISSMANLYQASNNMRYSEQVALLSNYGRPTESGDWEQKVWIPGGTWTASPTSLSGITKEKHPYMCLIDSQTIDSQDNILIFKPGTLTSSTTTSAINGATEPDQGLDNSFYAGFLTLANNTSGGINIRGWGSATPGGGMESYVLTGSRSVNYRLAASSGVGGTIYTTDMGNHQGDLSVGDKVGTSDTYSPYLIANTLGQSVTYTMTPQPGYKLKKVYTKKGDIDVMEDFQNGTANENTNLRNIGNGIYAYDFTKINSDNSIHVEWEPSKLKVKKQLSNSAATNENFTFRMKVLGSTHSNYDIKTALEAQGCTQVSEDTYEFTVKGNNEKEFSGVIPFGWSYEITEVSKDGWKLDSSSSNATTSNFDGDETVTFTNSKNIYDLTVNKETIDDKSGEFEFDVKVWKEPGEAYAVFDSADGSLKFFRDDKNKYTNNQTDGTKTYYTGIETTNYTDTSQIPWYSNRRNVQSVTFQDLIKPVSTAYWFYQMDDTKFKSITSIEKLDTSLVTNMKSMFRNCSFLTSLDASNFDTSNVTNMNAMFMGCSNLTELDVSHFDTSKATNMSEMFYNCRNLTTTLNVMKMPSSYFDMCYYAAKDSGQLTLKYISPVTSANINTLIATKERGNVVSGGEGLFIPPIKPEGNSETTIQYLNLSQYGGVSNGDNSYRFTVSNGNSFTIPDIPKGYKYEVKEVKKTGWKLESVDSDRSKTEASGMMDSDKNHTFLNKKDEIIITKKWDDGKTGKEANGRDYPEITLSGKKNTPKSFTYDISLDNNEVTPIADDDELNLNSANRMKSTRNVWIPAGNSFWIKVYDSDGNCYAYNDFEDIHSDEPNYVSDAVVHIRGINGEVIKLIDGVEPNLRTFTDMSNADELLDAINMYINTFNGFRIEVNGKLSPVITPSTASIWDFDYSAERPFIYTTGGFTIGDWLSESVEYKSSSDLSGWTKVDDDTWKYAFSVDDADIDYKTWESIIPEGYTTDTDENHKKGVVNGTATIKNTGTYDLKIKKNTMGDNDEFEFDVKIWSQDMPSTGGVPVINYIDLSSQGGTHVGNNVYRFKITTSNKTGEKIINNIPKGYQYEVTEVAKTGWHLDSSSNTDGVMSSDNEASFVNTKLTDITVYKQWDDGGKSHTVDDILSSFQLFRNGTSLSGVNPTVTDKGNGRWEYKVSNLPKYDENGNLYQYTVKEVMVPSGYTVEYEEGTFALDGDTITNHSDSDLVIKKETIGDVPGEFEFDVKVFMPGWYPTYTPDNSNYQSVISTTYYAYPESSDFMQHILTTDMTWTMRDGSTRKHPIITYDSPITGDREYAFCLNESKVLPSPNLEMHSDPNVNIIGMDTVQKIIHIYLTDEDLYTNFVDTFSTINNRLASKEAYVAFMQYAVWSITENKTVDEMLSKPYFIFKDYEQIIKSFYEELMYRVGSLDRIGTYMDLSQYGGVSNGDNSYRFTVSNGNSITLSALPYGSEYEITEVAKDGWTNVSKTNNRGTISSDTLSEWVNKKDNVSLNISKNVKGNLGDKTKKFAFELASDRELTIPGINPTSVTEEKYRGSCSIRAANGVYTMTSLVEGYPGYIKLSKEGETTYTNIDSTWELEQTIFNNVAQATIADKKVTFRLTDGRVFRFGFPNLYEGATATANNFRELVTTYTYKFTLADDETMSVSDVPYGTNITVNEKASNHIASYKVTKGSNSITNENENKETALKTANIMMNDNVSIEYTNTRGLETTTNATGTNILWLLIVLISTLLCLEVSREKPHVL